MPLPSWKRTLAVAALAVAPVLSGAPPALALPGPDTGAKPPDVAKATSLFMKGIELYKAKKYPQALDHFKQSYGMVPSPNSHLYIARCLAATGDSRAAWIELDRTIDEATAGGPKYAPTRDEATQERDDLGTKLGFVVVTVPGGPPGTRVRAGANEIPAARWGKPFPVAPATLDVIVETPGQPPIKKTVTVAPGERRDVQIDAAASIAVPAGGDAGGASHGGMSGLRIGAFVGWGVGVVGLSMLAAGGALSNSTYSSLQTVCGNKAGCPTPTTSRADADQKISAGKTQQAVANAGIALAVIGVAAGTTLFVLSLRKKRVESGLVLDQHHAADAKPGADLVVGPGWLGARGAF